MSARGSDDENAVGLAIDRGLGLARGELLADMALNPRQLSEYPVVVLDDGAERAAPHVLVRPLAGVQAQLGNRTGDQNHAGDIGVTGSGCLRTTSGSAAPLSRKRRGASR
jgi:hypothetical protein